MRIDTHENIDFDLCGKPVATGPGTSRVRFRITDRMAVDETGLAHGGFIFGLADHAAMLAVNHPNVVLGAAEVKFLKPIKTGNIIEAEAGVVTDTGRKQTVDVTVRRDGDPVFSGRFTCFVLDSHVLAPS